MHLEISGAPNTTNHHPPIANHVMKSYPRPHLHRTSSNLPLTFNLSPANIPPPSPAAVAAMSSHEAPKSAEMPYVPHDTISETGKTAVVGLAGGFLIASMQNALSRRNMGAFGIFTRGGPVIGLASEDSPRVE